MKHPRFVLVCLCSLWLASDAAAALIEVRFDGSLTNVNPSLSSFLDVGDPLTVGMAWDTNAPNQCSGANTGVYPMQSVSIAAAGAVLSAQGFIEADAPLGNCGLGPGTGAFFRFVDLGVINSGGLPFLQLSALLALLNLSGILGYHDALGAIPGPLPFEPWPTLFVSNAFAANGALTTIPEPGSLVLVGTGLLWWRLRRRRREGPRNSVRGDF